MTFRCFLSHPWASNVHHLAVRLSAELRRSDIEVWLDQEQMLPGQNITVRQQQGIVYESDVFVLLLAPATLASRNCMDELRCAVKHHRPMVAAIVERCEVPKPLAGALHVDFTNAAFFDASVGQLATGLRSLNRWQLIVGVLDHDDSEKRSEAARILTDLQDPGAYFAVKRRIAIEHDDTVSQWLARYLGSVEFPLGPAGEVKAILTELIRTGEFLTRHAAQAALERIEAREREAQFDEF